MKRFALTFAALATALAPAVHAQVYRSDDPVTADDPHYTAPDRTWQSDSAYTREYDRSDNDRDGRWREDHARVLESRPVYAQGGATHEECWNDDTKRYEGSHIGAGTVIGAIAGGVLGHQLGSGRGNDVATAAGAIGGGVVGNRIDRNRDAAPSDDTRCRTVSDSGSDVVAYDVRYEYRGREFTTRLDHDPGRFLDVGRDVRADGYPLDASVAAYPDRGVSWR